ncbi:hypothetical protein Cgig2_012691 [Carnegiea gigantea]|uniref:Uncharacterized protein n=1 Tax=Carnegiea gigantea TaxID=171969 RepID=A0A9Q1K020_9CARY|nr:hypothetical protein Cgig2_012691 [Carnegiea gigantea]
MLKNSESQKSVKRTPRLLIASDEEKNQVKANQRGKKEIDTKKGRRNRTSKSKGKESCYTNKAKGEKTKRFNATEKEAIRNIFDPYAIWLCLPEKKEIFKTALDVNLTFALPIGDVISTTKPFFYDGHEEPNQSGGNFHVQLAPMLYLDKVFFNNKRMVERLFPPIIGWTKETAPKKKKKGLMRNIRLLALEGAALIHH